MNDNYEELVITWSEKTPIVNSFESLKNDNSIGNKVLYQIYGDHHIYGRDTLLYIGITKNADARFYAHLKGVFGLVNMLTVSFGTLNYNDELFEVPESILIANHKPSYNKEFLHDLSKNAKKGKIIIINNGNNYMLKTCCTNYWWVS